MILELLLTIYMLHLGVLKLLLELVDLVLLHLNERLVSLLNLTSLLRLQSGLLQAFLALAASHRHCLVLVICVILRVDLDCVGCRLLGVVVSIGNQRCSITILPTLSSAALAATSCCRISSSIVLYLS